MAPLAKKTRNGKRMELIGLNSRLPSSSCSHLSIVKDVPNNGFLSFRELRFIQETILRVSIYMLAEREASETKSAALSPRRAH